MKKFSLTLFSLALVVLFSSKAFSQNYGIFADSSAFTTGGNLYTDSSLPAPGMYYMDGVSMWNYVTNPDSTISGRALHIQFFCGGDDRISFVPDTNNYGTVQADMSQWNAPNAQLIFYIKLIAPVDVNIAFNAWRDSSTIDESDEPLTDHGLNVHDTTTWQRIVVPLNRQDDGHHFDYSKWNWFAFRDRDNYSNFLVDEMYVNYSPKTTFGIFADSSAFNQDGHLLDNSAFPNSTLMTEDNCTFTQTTDPNNAFEGSNALDVSYTGKGKLVFTAEKADPENASAGTVNLGKFNEGTLFFSIKLLDTINVNVNIESIAYRLRSSDVNGSDENLADFGLNKSDTSWQRLNVDLTGPIDGDYFDYSQFLSFTFRSHGDSAHFMLDGVYVQYPTSATTAVQKEKTLPTMFSLKQNYPNPFNPSTAIEFSLPKSGQTTLEVYNVLGQKVIELVNRNMTAGNHEVTFNASTLPSGVYFYKLTSGNFSQVKKMMLLK